MPSLKINLRAACACAALFLIFTVNLYFSAGWDIWHQALTWLLSLTLFFTLFSNGSLLLSRLAFSPPVLIFALFTYLSLRFSATPYENLPAASGLISAVLIFSASSLYLSSPSARRKTAYLISRAGGTAAALDIIYAALNMKFFPNPHIKTGIYLLILPFAGLMLADSLRTANSNKDRFFSALPLLIMLFSFARARSLWGTAVLILSALIFMRKVLDIKLNKKLYLAPAVVIASGIGAGYSVSDRLSWLSAGVRMLISKPLTGFGPGSTPHILPFFAEGKLSLYIHSFYLQLAAENGVIAAVAFTAAVIIILKKTSVKQAVSAAAFTGLISLFIYNILEYNLLVPLLYVSAAGIAGGFSDAGFIRIKLGKFRTLLLILLALFPLGILAEKITALYISSRFFITAAEALEKNDPGKALEAAGRSLETRYFPPSELARALALIGSGELEKAAGIIHSLYPDPKGGLSYEKYLQGIEALREGNTEDAVKSLEEAARIRLTQFAVQIRT